MGILTKIQNGNSLAGNFQKTADGGDKKTPVEKKSTTSPPLCQCEKCGSVQFWLDAYQNWNCGGCVPPRVPAMIRQVYTIDLDAETFEFNGETWVKRQDCEGNWGWELASLTERDRWWARSTFEQLPQGDLLKLLWPSQKNEKGVKHGR
jgi:hypothetical protein